MTRRERIAFLLAHYSDVLAGVRDRGLGGEHLPLMCSAWNHPSYQELERLLPLLGYDLRPLYRAVMGMYVHPRFVRRAVCPRCGVISVPANVGELHRHNHRSVILVARMVRVPLYPVEPDDDDITEEVPLAGRAARESRGAALPERPSRARPRAPRR